MDDIFTIQIEIVNNTPYIDCSGNTPALLADKIKEIVKEYFKEK